MPHLVDMLVLFSFCGALFAVAAIGILALPWRDSELDETVRAVRTGWRVLDASFQRVSGRAPVEPVPTEATAGFDRAPVTRVPLG